MYIYSIYIYIYIYIYIIFIYIYITSYFLNNLVFIYIRMLKNSSAKYYQKTKICLRKKG